jgi:simple sugar transport system permease protein
VPIGMAGLGGLWSERAGVVNIGLEGMMILGTWGAGFFGYHYGPWAGLLGAMVCGMLGGAVHALATVVFGVDHIVSGVAINIIGAGAAKYLAARTFTGTPGGGPTQSPPLEPLPTLSIPASPRGWGHWSRSRSSSCPTWPPSCVPS